MASEACRPALVQVSEILFDVAGPVAAHRLACEWSDGNWGRDTRLRPVADADASPIIFGGYTLTALRFLHHRLEAELRRGDARLLSMGDHVVVTIPMTMPATAVVATIGLPIREVVQIPLTLGSDRNRIEHAFSSRERPQSIFRVFAGSRVVLVNG